MPHPNDSYHARRRRKARVGLEGGTMRVIGGKNRPDALLEPGVDFILEHAIQQEAGERVIDTGIDFVPPVATRLNGRKYIGENTVKTLAGLIGYVPGEAARQIQADFDAYKQKVADLLADLDGVGGRIQDVIAAAQPDPNTISVTPPADASQEADLAAQRQADEQATIVASEEAKA